MPVFVHLTSHRNLKSIRRTGLGLGRSGGIFALPVTLNFLVAHQWLRELRRLGAGTVVGVYFRLAGNEPVSIGSYCGLRREVTAAEAVALMLEAEQRDPAAAMAADLGRPPKVRRRNLSSSPLGFEVIIPRSIAPSEVIRVKRVPQTVGWRYRPDAKGASPSACLWSERGSWGLRRLERAVVEAEEAGRKPRITLFSRDVSEARRAGRPRAGRKTSE